MWLVKGVLSGLLLFGVFTVIYFRGIIGPPREGVATALSVVTASTIYQPLWWTVLVFTMATSCLWAGVLHLAFERR